MTAQASDRDGCRLCRIEAQVPLAWRELGSHCVVVPVQVLETWLLCLRGFDFSNLIPENNFDRRALKTRFPGSPKPPAQERVQLALQELERPGAVETLRKRQSFLQFETIVAGW